MKRKQNSIDPHIDLIIIGDEILSGKTCDSNSHFISFELMRSGFSVRSVTIVRDNHAEIAHAIQRSLAAADVVIISGGLGPTPDDITRFAVADALGRKLVRHEKLVKIIHKRLSYSSKRLKKISEVEALMPSGAKPLINTVGVAPGFSLLSDRTTFFCIPGVPAEARAMFDTYIKPFCKKNFDAHTMVHRIIKTIGIGESRLYDMVKPIIPKKVTVGFYPKGYEVELQLHARVSEAKIVDRALERIKKKLGSAVYAFEASTIEESVGKALRKRRLICATAESCTGGLIGKRLTDGMGASHFYVGSIIAYANSIKEKELGVSRHLLQKHGAVSAPVARSMAKGLARAMGVDVAISCTGIAGPGGGSPHKPVGLVFIGIYYKGDVRVKKFQFKGDRARIRWLTSQCAFDLVWQRLQNG